MTTLARSAGVVILAWAAGCAGPANVLPVTATPVPRQSPSPATPTPTGARLAQLTPTGDEVLALVNGTLIDGAGAAPIHDAAIAIHGGRIAAAGARAHVNIPANAKIIDV